MNKSEIDLLIESCVSQKKKKNLVCGVGIYDVEFLSSIEVDGKRNHHRGYKVWSHMLERCYQPNTEKLARNYAGCTVSNEWLRFSNFFPFWKENYQEGYQLDKDLLHPGNKEYSPKHCVFISSALNNFTLDHEYARGEYPLGVYFSKQKNKFHAVVYVNGKKKHIGFFDDPLEAHLAWHNKKLELAANWKEICDEIHPRLFAGLMSKVRMMREKKSNN